MRTPLDTLGGRWGKELRVRYSGPQAAAASLIARARVQVGTMERQRFLAGVNQAHMIRTYADGVRIRTLFTGLELIAEIEATSMQGEEQQFDLWIPRGFVVVPAASAAPLGWGLPALPPPGAPDPLDLGPLPAAWSPGGALPQVLLTRVRDAGYPDSVRPAMPMYFDDFEREEPIELPDEDGAWAAFRPAFYDIGTAGRAVVTAINEERPTSDPLAAPIRGFTQLADWLRRLVGRFGLSESAYPPGSNTWWKRLSKDGTAREVATHSPVGSIGVVDTSSAATPADVAAALIAAVPDLATNTTIKVGATLALAGEGGLTYMALVDHTAQWVRCGNIDWKSIHPEIPRLSWTGPRGRAVPSYEMSGGIFPIGTSGLTANFTFYLPDLAERTLDEVKEREWDRFIYARGRVLAQLPNDGYVLGAAIQRVDLGDGASVYRLYAIGWHRADQKLLELIADGHALPYPSPGWFDTTSDVRIWYADLPTRNGLACAPDRIVDGLYDLHDNPAGWQGGIRYRLSDYSAQTHWPGNFLRDTLSAAAQGYTEQAIKAPKTYWHGWFFNGSGTEATCLRGDAWGGRGTAGVFWATALWPSQQLTLTITPTIGVPAPTITSAWEVLGADPDGGFFAPGNPTADRVLAVDYAGDEKRVVRIVNSVAGSPRIALTSARGMLYDFSGVLVGGTAGVTAQLAYLDARSDMFAVAEHHFVEPADGTSTTQLRLFVDGAQVSSSGTAAHPNTPYWFGVNGFNLTVPATPGLNQAWFGTHTNPVYASTIAAGLQFIDAPVARYDADFVAGARYATFTAGPNFTVTRLGAVSASSFNAAALYGVPDGWLNFAGVV